MILFSTPSGSPLTLQLLLTTLLLFGLTASGCSESSRSNAAESKALTEAAAPERSETALYDGRPPQGLLTRPENVVVSAEATTIRREVPIRHDTHDVYLFAIPEGDLGLDIQALSLRSLKTGEEVDLFSEEKSLLKRNVLPRIEKQIELGEFGHFRGLRAGRLAVRHPVRVHHEGSVYEIASYELAARYPKAAEPAQPSSDAAWEDGTLYRDMIEKTLLVPEVFERFLQQEVYTSLESPAEWQPRPEDSPRIPWLKIPIRKDGLYKIDGQWFAQAGIDSSTIEPERVQILHRGSRVPIHLIDKSGAEGGSGFHQGRELIFYAEGNDSEETLESVYYLGSLPEGREFAAMESPESGGGGEALSQFTRRIVVEEDNERQTDFGAFLSIQNITWTWADLYEQDETEIQFDLPGLVASPADDSTTLTLNIYTPEQRYLRNKELSYSLNGGGERRIALVFRQNSYPVSFRADEFQRHRNRMSLQIVETRSSTPDAPEQSAIWLDNLEIRYPSRFALDGLEAYPIHFPEISAFEPGLKRLDFSNWQADDFWVLDLTEPDSPSLLTPAEGEEGTFLSCEVAPDTDLLVAAKASVPKAPAPSRSRWIDWTKTDRSADILIVHHQLFQKAAQLLARDLQKQGYEPLAVDVETLYESFNYGELSSEAIRRFLARAVTEWEGRRPVAAILIGDSSSDGRNLSGDDVPNYMPIPLTRQLTGRQKARFSTDSLYSWLTGSDEAADLIIGRVSSTTPEDALSWVRNASTYRQQQDVPSEWAGRLLSVADTGGFAESLDEVTGRHLARDFEHRMLAADSFAWEDNYYLPEHLIRREEDSKVSPLLTSAIENQFNQGAGVVMFFGHGAPNLWSNQRFWFGGGTPNSDILRLKNGERLPFVTSFTCNNAVVDYPLRPWNVCIAEDFMRHPGKGAIGAFMPSGPGFLNDHKVMAEGFLRAWTNLGVRSQGVLAELSRIYYQAHEPRDNHSRMFLFLGDPTLRLPPGKSGEEKALRPSDARLVRLGGDVLLEELNELGPEEAPSGKKAWSLVIGNQMEEARTAHLVSELRTADGAVLQREEEDLELEPRERIFRKIGFDVPGPGGYTARFRLEHPSHAWMKDNLPSRSANKFFIVPESGRGRVEIARESIELSSATGVSGSPRLAMIVYNTGSDDRNVVITGRVVYKGRQADTFERPQFRVAAGRSALVNESVSLPLQIEEPVEIEVAMETIDDPESREPQRVFWDFPPAKLPDLAIVPGSVEVSPRPLSDGLTVFVDLQVENRGRVPSPPVEAGLFLDESFEHGEVLRDMTGSDLISVAPIAPGESRNIRLRWDPADNAGRYEIFARIDASDRLIESDKSNNSLPIPLHVREKADLEPGELIVGRGQERGDVVLIAKVANKGETDAKSVSVSFYESRQQTEENKIAEVLLDRVPAGETAEAVHVWQVRDLDSLSEEMAITFTVALKGSQMRASSVVDE